MKKLIAILCLLAMCVSMVGCAKDETPPVITLANSSLNCYVGDGRPNYEALVTVNDEKDGPIEAFEVDDSAVDYNKSGAYKALVFATDAAGNTARASIDVTVLYNAKWQPAMKDGVPALTFTKDEFVSAMNQASVKDDYVDWMISEYNGKYEMGSTDYMDNLMYFGGVSFREFEDGTLYAVDLVMGWNSWLEYGNMAEKTNAWVNNKLQSTMEHAFINLYYGMLFETLFPGEYAYKISAALGDAMEGKYLIGGPNIDDYHSWAEELPNAGVFKHNGYRFYITAISNAVILTITADENGNAL